MSNLQPHEMVIYQLVIKPSDDKWKEHTKHLVEELKGVPVSTIVGYLKRLFIFSGFAGQDFGGNCFGRGRR